MPAAALAQAQPPTAPVAVKINPTMRVLRFIVPLTDGPTYLGDVELAVSPQDELSVVAPRLLQMLEPLLKPDVFERLRAAAGTADEISAEQLAGQQLLLSYDSQRLALSIAIPVSARRPRSLSLRGPLGQQAATYEPAKFSAYLNLRSAVDVVERGPDTGIRAPIVALDGAMRLFDTVLEGEGLVSLGGRDPGFRRIGTRLVYDDLHRTMRWIGGDLRPLPRSFQGAAPIGGLGVSRLYSVLEPQREIRSTGARSFTINSPSLVETVVNGRTVERRRFEPGTYTLQDFPLAEGSNDVRLLIEDEAGNRRTVDFNLFSNRSLLEVGLTEFSVVAGVQSRPTRRGIVYSDDWIASGFARFGVSEQLSFGVNAQAEGRAQQAGMEILLGTGVGLFGLDVAGSHARRAGWGYATVLTYQHLIQRGGYIGSQAVRASLEYRSREFAIPGAALFDQPFSLQANAGYSYTFGIDSFAAVDLRYQKNRFGVPDEVGARGIVGVRLTDSLSATGETEYRRQGGRDDLLFRIGLILHLGPRATVRAEADDRGRVRASFQDSGGRGIGAWNLSGDFVRTGNGAAINASGSLLTNRAELGVSHIGAYDSVRGRLGEQRTSFRAGTSIAFADGELGIGRPIIDSFLLASPHPSLKQAELRIDPAQQGDIARSGAFGPALAPDLTAYASRSVVYDVPKAPPGYDLGAGNVQVAPPYRSGYRLEVGSDYNLTVIGRLVDLRGEPVSLLAGKAVELARPERPQVTLFTSREGRFAAQGLRPGRWRIEMPTKPPSQFIMVVKEEDDGIVRVGDLSPVTAKGDEQ